MGLPRRMLARYIDGRFALFIVCEGVAMTALHSSSVVKAAGWLALCLMVCGCDEASFKPPQQAFNRADYQQQMQEQRQRIADELANGGGNNPAYTVTEHDANSSKPGSGGMFVLNIPYEEHEGAYATGHDQHAETTPPTGSFIGSHPHGEHAADEHAEHSHAPDGHAPDGHAADGHAADGHAEHSHAATGGAAESPQRAGGLQFLTNEPTGEVKLRAGVALAQTLPTGTAMMFSVDYTFDARRSGLFGWAIFGQGGKAMVRRIKLNTQGNLTTYHPAIKPGDGPFECQIVEIVGSNLRPLSARHRMK